MTYDELYNNILIELDKSINTNNKDLREKITSEFLNWYKKNCELELKNAISVSDDGLITNILNEIKKIFDFNDKNKLIYITEDSNFINFLKTSDFIFSLVKKQLLKQNYEFLESDYQKYLDLLKSYKSAINPIFMDNYKKVLSECLLDLEFLKNKGKVSFYSFRTSRYIEGTKI